MFIRKWNKVFTRRNGKSKVTMPSRRKTAPTGVAIVGSSLGLSRTFTPALFPCQLRQPWLPQCYRGKRERIIVAELITWQAAPTPAPPNTPTQQTRQEASYTATPTKLPERRSKGVIVSHLATPGQAALTPPQTPAEGSITVVLCTELHQTKHFTEARNSKRRQCCGS